MYRIFLLDILFIPQLHNSELRLIHSFGSIFPSLLKDGRTEKHDSLHYIYKFVLNENSWGDHFLLYYCYTITVERFENIISNIEI